MLGWIWNQPTCLSLFWGKMSNNERLTKICLFCTGDATMWPDQYQPLVCHDMSISSIPNVLSPSEIPAAAGKGVSLTASV